MCMVVLIQKNVGDMQDMDACSFLGPKSTVLLQMLVLNHRICHFDMGENKDYGYHTKQFLD